MGQLTNLARNQRHTRNPWELKLWQHLRTHRFYGLPFKRQVPFGNKYIVDFCCKSKLVIIELDGGQHSEQTVSTKDKEKEQYLIQQGYRVLRFWNNELDDNMEGVLETIRRAIFNGSTPP